MRVSLVLLGGIVILSVAVARALSCFCSPVECDSLTDEDCPGGLTWDPCKCCKLCARVEGEPCGGLFGFSGSCADGLQCVITSLLDHAREVDEGTCTKIPGRRRRHCPQGQKMSEAGCNLVGDGVIRPGNGSGTSKNKENVAGGRCVCGAPVPWCPEEPKPYTYRTRRECQLNLAAKLANDVLFNSNDDATIEDLHGSPCPDDSIVSENGGCTCISPCPPGKCGPGDRPVEVRPAAPDTPGECCALYKCVPKDAVSWDGPEDVGQTLSHCIDHSGHPRREGERWNEEPCVNCVCEDGQAACQATMCKSCDNPRPIENGECCPHCPSTTNSTIDATRNDECDRSKDCHLVCERGYDRDSSGCEICECSETEVRTSTDSLDDTQICPQLSHCTLSCELDDDEGGCPICACRDNDVPTSRVPTRKICPALSCDLHCETGLAIDDEGCTTCSCNPKPGCPSFACKKDCPLGYKTNKRGCQICRCRSTCVDYRNISHAEGSSWNLDRCTSCSCDQGGRMNCKETVCSVACLDPLPPPDTQCCPVCPVKMELDGSTPTGMKGWAHVTVTVVLAALCIGLTIHAVRGRFRGRLSPAEASYTAYPNQYYKCIPVYDTPVHQNEKIVPL